VTTDSRHQTWFLDQLTKSEFFHQKLHEWKMLSVAEAVEAFRGETLQWNLPDLGISEAAEPGHPPGNQAGHRLRPSAGLDDDSGLNRLLPDALHGFAEIYGTGGIDGERV